MDNEPAEVAQEPEVPRRPTFAERWRRIQGPYAQLFPYLRPYLPRFIAGIVFGAMAGAVSGLLAFVIKYGMEHVFPAGATKAQMAQMAAAEGGASLQNVLLACAAIPGVIMLRSLLSYLNAYCMAWVSLKVLVDIRSELFQHLIRQGLDFFNKSRAGNLISRVANDTRMAQNALTVVSSDVIIQPFTIIFAIGAMFTLDAKFTAISLVLFPLCLVPIIVFGRRVRRSGTDEEAGAGAMMVIMHEAFGGIKVVKALGREKYEYDRFRQSGKDQFRHSIRVRKAIEIVGPIIESVSALGIGVALVYVYFSGMGAPKFFGLMTATFMLYEPMKKLSRVHVQMQKCLASTTRIFELMQKEPTIVDAPGAKKLSRVKGHIQFHDVQFYYRRGARALRNFSLEIQPGQTCALVGASGAGKSTVLSLLLRFYEPRAGNITIDGHDIRDVTQQSLRDNIGIVTQETFLFHDTIFKNIQYGRLDATEEEVYEAARLAYAHDFILDQPNGYDTVIGDKGSLLSGGQQQRIAIARALLRNAPILLLDEATSALDTASEQQIQAALDNLSTGRTVIAIAHRLSTIMRAHQIVVMHRGHIRDVGTHEELLEKSRIYRRLNDPNSEQQDGFERLSEEERAERRERREHRTLRRRKGAAPELAAVITDAQRDINEQ
jgi:subfamily B ATP-binding cassette protein MsbA